MKRLGREKQIEWERERELDNSNICVWNFSRREAKKEKHRKCFIWIFRWLARIQRRISNNIFISLFTTEHFSLEKCAFNLCRLAFGTIFSVVAVVVACCLDIVSKVVCTLHTHTRTSKHMAWQRRDKTGPQCCNQYVYAMRRNEMPEMLW